MNNDFYKAVENRRSLYALSKESVISDQRITELVQYAVKHSPSAFNSQTGRAVVLLGEQHNKLWDATMEILKKVVPPEFFGQTEERINGFHNGYGTVLFFEDQSIIESLQKQFELYKDNFPVWSLQSSGMLQYVVWTSLEMEGMGASLQHYNPLIDEFVHTEWKIPTNWKLLSQMVFGKPLTPAGPKEFSPVENRVKVIK